jgi:hypothetical protein
MGVKTSNVAASNPKPVEPKVDSKYKTNENSGFER